MKIEVDRKDLKALVKGVVPSYSEFNNELVIKAGHSYSDQYGKTDWNNLNDLTDDELYSLYLICKNSWKQ
jgi:hypothetical protein